MLGDAESHPLRGPEIRALRQFAREYPLSPYLFITERSDPMTAAGFRKMLARVSELSNLGFPVRPHMPRHGCGYKLSNDGQNPDGPHTVK